MAAHGGSHIQIFTLKMLVFLSFFIIIIIIISMKSIPLCLTDEW